MIGKRKGVVKCCKACDKEFYVPNYRKDKAKFCSKECLNHKQYERTVLICQGCDKEFKVSESRTDKKFCSLECKSLKSFTEKERRSRANVLRSLKRGTNSSRNLKNTLSKIRGIYCDNCGYNKASYNLEVHHKDGNPCNNILENLSILCVMCHRDLHYGDLRLKDNKYYYEKN